MSKSRSSRKFLLFFAAVLTAMAVLLAAGFRYQHRSRQSCVTWYAPATLYGNETVRADFRVINLFEFDESLRVSHKHKTHVPTISQVGRIAVVAEEKVDGPLILTDGHSELPEVMHFDRGESKYQLNSSPSKSELWKGAHRTNILVLPIQGISYGETFGSTLYMGFVALKAISQMRGVNFQHITVVVVDKPASSLSEKKTEDEDTLSHHDLCTYSPSKRRPYKHGFWPVGDINSDGVSRNESFAWRNLSDGTNFVVNFSDVMFGCDRAGFQNAWAQERKVFVLDAINTWGVEVIDWSKDQAPIFIEYGYILNAQLLKGWIQEYAATPIHLQPLIQTMQRHFLGQVPTANSEERNIIVIATRALKVDRQRSCCICKRLWANEKQVVQHFRSHRPDLDIRVVDFDELSLRETVILMNKANLLVGLHGSALWNVLFMYHTSAVVEFWPRGYFEEKYYNQPRFVGVSYVYEEVPEGNWVGHNAWTVVPTNQALRLLDLALSLVDMKKEKLVSI